MLSRITAPFMIILVIGQIGAAWTVFSTAIWIHQQNKQARLSDKGKWEEFVLSSAEFESRLIEDDEIELDAKLYDIVFVQRVGSQVIITAVADHAENKMKKTLDGLQQEETGWSELAKCAQAFSMSIFCPEKTLQVNIPPSTAAVTYFTFAANNFFKGIFCIPDQPPAA